MRLRAKALLAAIAVSAVVLAWGYWHSTNHVSLALRVDDYSLKSERQAYGVPHDVTLTLRDNTNVPLAVARSVEPLGYILAVHPNAEIGHCEHRGITPSPRNRSQDDYAACYKEYSSWSATWASRVYSADRALPCRSPKDLRAGVGSLLQRPFGAERVRIGTPPRV
jgi:hypothetical protein